MKIHSASLLLRASRLTTTTTVTRTLALRTFRTTTAAAASLPYHVVVGLPALSPTMETGVVSQWYVQEGDKVQAGDALAQMETDKASMDFEAQDDAYIAKLLLPTLPSPELKVGTPILITVEDEADVAAFANYQVVVEEQEDETLTPDSGAVQAPPPKKEEVVQVAPVATPTPPAPVAPPPPPSKTTTKTTTTITTTTVDSPLQKSLLRQQQQYVQLYGTTGQTVSTN